MGCDSSSKLLECLDSLESDATRCASDEDVHILQSEIERHG